ncbi:MAG: TonB family protein [Bacteroidales bacterium]|nr:TonB family protein [Bacteroidales bacterium]
MMKRHLLSLSLLLMPLMASAQFRDGGYSSLDDSETMGVFRDHVSYIAGAQMEGRKAGSEGEKMTAEYISDMFAEYGVDVLSSRSGDEFGLRDGADTLVSRNVLGFIQGYDKTLRDRYIVVGARLDNLGTHTMKIDGEDYRSTYYGANGNASGLAMMLELARMVSTNSLLFRRSILFVGFGASCNTFAGSWYFLNRAFKDVANIDAMINLDMLGTADREGFFAFTASNKGMNALVDEVSSQLQPITPKVVSNPFYPSDYVAFYEKEIPSVTFTTGRYNEHNTFKDTPDILDYESMERELEYVYNFLFAISNREKKIEFKEEALKVARPSYDNDVVPFFDCEIKPSFLGSYDPSTFLQKWVYPYLKYPQAAVERGIQGTVQVNFVIEKDGKLTNATIVKSVDPLLDDEALKVINASPKWKPAKAKGQKIRSTMTIPVEFKLEKKGTKKKIGINGNI